MNYYIQIILQDEESEDITLKEIINWSYKNNKIPFKIIKEKENEIFKYYNKKEKKLKYIVLSFAYLEEFKA